MVLIKQRVLSFAERRQQCVRIPVLTGALLGAACAW